MKQISDCRLCGNSKYKIIEIQYYNGNPYTIARCSVCTLIYVKETYAPISPDYMELTESDINENRLWVQGKHKEPAFRQLLNLVDGFTSKKGKKEFAERQLLDIGCGSGGWLKYASQHFSSLYGFDASKAQSDYARKSFSNVRCASSIKEYLSLLECTSTKFDLITMWDVLEHIHRPVSFLKCVPEILTSKGIFFIASPSAIPALIKSKLSFIWPGFTWHPHEHVTYFSPKTLTFLCQKLGLSIYKIGSVKVYPRPLSLFEIFRRFGFFITNRIPFYAPQIYVLAGK